MMQTNMRCVDATHEGQFTLVNGANKQPVKETCLDLVGSLNQRSSGYTAE